jgi:hypothetical protein
MTGSTRYDRRDQEDHPHKAIRTAQEQMNLLMD